MEQNGTRTYSWQLAYHYHQSNDAFGNGTSGESSVSELTVSPSSFKGLEGKKKKAPCPIFNFFVDKTLPLKLSVGWAQAPGVSAPWAEICTEILLG